MNFVTWSIRNPVPVLMMFIALVLGGLIAFPRLAVQNQPDIQFPFVFVQVSYPGVPPSQMETEVTRKVEDAVASIVGTCVMPCRASALTCRWTPTNPISVAPQRLAIRCSPSRSRPTR